MTQIVRLSELRRDSSLRHRVTGAAASIGNFDGVHRGHQQLLRQTRRIADRVGGPAVAVVMDPHPAAVLRPHGAPTPLSSMTTRAERMSGVGIDWLLVCETTQSFLNRTAEEFFDFLVGEILLAKALVEGPNFYFGRDRGGNIELLRRLCDRDGMQLQIAEPLIDDGRMVSSSRIREAIAGGDVGMAAAMMGANHQISGRVVAGQGRGRTLGFATANLDDVAVMVPAQGVYAAMAIGDATGPLPCPAAVHIGPNPTFERSGKDKIEVHLLDFTGNLYDSSLRVDFLDRIRPVRRFDSVEDLRRQLDQDIARVRHLADTSPPISPSIGSS